jgi:DNA invertase Pin-like site-specific DNA recombinase
MDSFDAYIRVSKVGDRGGSKSFISPDVQRETIERLASAHKLTIGEVVEELDISGEKPIDERELGRLIRKVEEGASGGLLVWKLSRFSRSLLDGVTVADRIQRAGGRLLAEDFDSSAPMGKAMLGLLLGWAEEELDARRAGWRAAQRHAAKRGVFPSRTPVGYRRIEEEGEDKGRFVPDPDTAPLVTALFKARAGGASLGSCATRLMEAIPGRGWSLATMTQLFANPVYLGKIVHGGDIYVEGAHPALIDERTWTLAQRSGPRTPRNGSIAGKGVLLGLVRCAGCGNRLTQFASGPPGARIANYTCRRRRASGVCPAPASAQVARVDALVEPEIDKRARAGALDLERMLVELFDAQTAYAAASRELEQFLEAGLVSELGPELYAREVSRRREAVNAAADAYRDALDAEDAISELDQSGIAARREGARQLIESVTLRKATRGRWQPIEDRVEIVWRAQR